MIQKEAFAEGADPEMQVIVPREGVGGWEGRGECWCPFPGAVPRRLDFVHPLAKALRALEINMISNSLFCQSHSQSAQLPAVISYKKGNLTLKKKRNDNLSIQPSLYD